MMVSFEEEHLIFSETGSRLGKLVKDGELNFIWTFEPDSEVVLVQEELNGILARVIELNFILTTPERDKL
jgi:hypothetical protein